MKELELKQYVEAKEDQVYTTSRLVAERFNRRHKYVLSAIRKIKNLTGPNFQLSSYIDTTGKENIEYEITEVGFMLLAMRFTGEEALKVQIKFVDAFQAMKQFIQGAQGYADLESKRLKAIPFAEPVFKTFKNVGIEFGLEKNQALLFANKATKRETGVDFQSILQIELKNEKQQAMLTPTEIGKRLQISAQQVNKLLSEKGYQNKVDGRWIVTEAGKQYAEILDVGKAHSDGTPIQQVKWYESVLETPLKAS